MQEFDEIWQLALDVLKNKYSETVMSLWFKDIKLTQVTDTKALIFVPSAFKKGILEKNHAAAISEALREVLGYEVELVFTSDERFVLELAEKTEAEPEQITVSAATEQTEEKTESSPVSASPAEPSFFTPSEKESAVKITHTSEYTFDNFIVGSSNKFAHAACLSVATNPANSYNPLFIYGPSGLGKTHLLYAIINEIHKNNPDFNIIYVKGDEFTNQMIESIGKGHTAEFRERFRKADVLLIDDIHFIAGKESTQEEFFHTFNDLYEHHKQIILTSDRPARDIQHLEERLRTRFEWGLPADIQPPDFELRVAIMRNKAEALGTSFPIEVLNFLAEKLTNNIRQMEGAIKRIIAYSRLNGEDITIALVNNCISDLLSNNGMVKVTPENIVAKIAEKYDISVNDIYSNKRTSNIAKARHICVYLMRKMLNMSFPAMGKAIRRDYTTAMHSVDFIEKEIKNDSSFEIEINELIKEFHS